MYVQPFIALADRWRADAVNLRDRYADARAAHLVETLRKELLDTIERTHDEVLTLADAARISGYSRDHLARLIREGKIDNAGRPHAPRIRRGDLPCKAVLPDARDEHNVPSLDRVRIARSIVNLQQ